MSESDDYRDSYEIASSDAYIAETKIENALDLAFRFAQIDGDHHKTWVIDQMVRKLTGDNYENWVKEYKGKWNAVNEEFEYEWNEGIAP